MKRALPVLLALFIGTSAYAHAPGGSAVAPTPAIAAEAVPKADPTSGSNSPTMGDAGSATTGNNQATSGSAGTGSGSAATSNAPAPAGAKGPQPKAWYDILADKPIEEQGTIWMPKTVIQAADEPDMMFYAVLALSIFFFVAIAVAVIYLTIKYRHRPGHKAEPSAAHNDVLEITWTVIPTLICVFLFWYGWHSYIRVVTPPNKAVEIDVLAQRWNWTFTHENGVTDSDLHIPANVPVRLVMPSKAELHSFYAPAMRVKQDVVPRRYTYAWFNATKPGTYRLPCAENCGTRHAQMDCLDVDPVTDHCHRRAVVGGSVMMDENFGRESILYPAKKARPGFPISMPPFEGQLKDRELDGLIAYIKSLKQ